MSEYRFDDQVVIVTGAGNGLGKSHALEFARRGAKVVVNDLGGSGRGEGESADAAKIVADEIIAEGGEAVANTDSVENGEWIVQSALDAFGRIDVLINNAGILRDAAFHKMSEEDWDLIYKVHLKGSYAVTRAAWPYMRERSYGRVLMTSSGAGIYGNFGQANYAAVKLGLHGLAQTLAIEGRSKGIHVNTIAPVAASRLTETVMTPEMLETLKSELVTPLAIFLCGDACTETGQLFEVGGGWISRVRWEQSRGVSFDPKSGFTVEELAGRWSEVQSFENSRHPMFAMDTFNTIGENIGVPLGLAPQ